MLTKPELRERFSSEWKKHYDLEVLHEYGFKRRVCKVCGRHFWSVEERETCGDPSCEGYRFIGNPVGKRHDYIDAWRTIEKYFVANGHKSIYTYPSVARWRDDLYFTIASISDFQPYVVRGEVDPPGNPLIIPQVCIRFGDISNVGFTGRHLTNFVMVGQHAFNTKKTGLFYWKNEAIKHDIEMLKNFGIPLTEITFKEDVWMGGGNFGPSMEYFVRGLELGNCVFMQYQILPDGSTKELDTKVIDMGAGLERFSWLTNGTPTLYDTTFGPVIDRMFKESGVVYDRELAVRFWSLAGGLDVEEGNLETAKQKISSELGLSWDEIMNKIQPYQALYAIADHIKTILLTSTDGQLPSNSGGGYNLRMILRRSFGFNERFGFNLDFGSIVKWHAERINPLFPHYMEGVETAIAVIEEEYKKYKRTKEKTKGRVSTFIRKVKSGKVDQSSLIRELKVLYESNGIPPELVAEVAEHEGIRLEIPENFYDLIRDKDESKQEEGMTPALDLDDVEDTVIGYYDNVFEMDAKVVKVLDKYVILDRTCFYPEGGGQVGDTGYINDVRVINTIKQGRVILHEVDPKDVSKFKVGDTVHLRIDKERRIQITLHHTGVHLLNACAREVLGIHVWQAGSYKDEFKGQIDLTHYRKITEDELRKIERLANKYIREELPVKIEELDRTTAEQKYGMRIYQGGAVPGKKLRIVSIGDIDHEACGGTHHIIDNIGRLGYLKIIHREGVKDGVERLVIVCGERAVEYVQEREKMIKELANILSSPESQLVRSTEKMVEEWKASRKREERLKDLVADRIVNEIITRSGEKPLMIDLDLDRDLLMKIGQKITQMDTDVEVVLKNNNGDVVCAIGKRVNKDIKELVDYVIKRFGGKGGGKGRLGFVKVKLSES